ncbi:MAG: hypothetical protein WCG82_10955 [Bacteroidota bacterium]
MKRKPIKIIVSFILLFIASCEEPETIVTNYVHPDGSVTRKIEMRNLKNNFGQSDVQVPFDSTWTVRDSIEIGVKGDTTWVKRAEKEFKNIDEINLAYKFNSGANKGISRQAGFKKSFKWFNTEYRFFERIDRQLSFGFPVKDFLDNEELSYFYSPENLKHDKETGPDSLKFRALADSVKMKTDIWNSKNLVSGWIDEFSKLSQGKEGGQKVVESVRSHENELITLINTNDEKLDSLWSNGIILKRFMSENEYNTFKSEADSAIENVVDQIFFNFKDYSVRIAMPGKLIGANGFIDSSQVMIWPVRSDFFLTEPYEMWAESKIPNRWAWIVSGLFLVFVLTGVIMRVIKKG